MLTKVEERRAPAVAVEGSLLPAGATRDRPELARLLDQLRPEDVVVVTRLDRLARSTRDLLDIAETLNRAGAGLRSLAEPWADTISPRGE